MLTEIFFELFITMFALIHGADEEINCFKLASFMKPIECYSKAIELVKWCACHINMYRSRNKPNGMVVVQI